MRGLTFGVDGASQPPKSARRARCRKEIKTSMAGLLAILFASTTIPTLANDWRDEAMSGFATNALLRAYEVSGLDGPGPAPLRLQKYIVTIRANVNAFDVFFLAQTEAVAIPVEVSARTGAIIWKKGDAPNAATMPTLPGGLILPGIIAGEIIAAYRQAASDQFKPLNSGAYNLWYRPFGGGSDVGFSRLDSAPSTISTQPAATPTPNHNQRCFAVGLTGPDYSVTVIDNDLRVHRNHAGCG